MPGSILCLAAVLFFATPSPATAESSSGQTPPNGTRILSADDVTSFKEVWGFVNQWSISSTYSKDMPITDVCLFSGDFDCYGNILDMPKRSSIDAGDARVHMVMICDGTSLSHLVLNPVFGYRNRLINEIVAGCADFDGLMIDFESIPNQDGELFIDFLAELRARLTDKMLSICVPARTSRLKNDIFPYARISNLVDRVFIMSYDQHWSGGPAGAIAELGWSKRVMDYAKTVIPEGKLIMGMPFYGRTWSTDSGAGAWTYPSITRILKEQNINKITYSQGFPTFSYTTEVKVTGWYNDAYAVFGLCRQYEENGIQAVGFWRIGQEDTSFWEHLKIR